MYLDRHADLQKQYTEAAHTLTEQKELISQLENDLLSVNALPSSLRGQGEVSKTGDKCTSTSFQNTSSISLSFSLYRFLL